MVLITHTSYVTKTNNNFPLFLALDEVLFLVYLSSIDSTGYGCFTNQLVLH